jgi:cation diffusion facilitator family transporter
MTQAVSNVPRLERRAAMVAVVVGVLLMVAKFVAYAYTGSAAIFSDALESIVNIVASGMAFVVLRIAHTPPDANHPYGHGKIEFLSAALEGGMICAAAGAIIVKAVHDLRTPELAIEHLGFGLSVTIGGGVINAMVGLMLLRLGRRSGSATLVADGQHLLSDFITSVGAIVALVIVQTTGWSVADPLVALLMAATSSSWAGSCSSGRSTC